MKPDEFAPDKAAVIAGGTGEVLNFGDMTSRSRKLARYLHGAGLRPGDVIALLLDNRPESLAVIWGVHRLGLCYTLLNWHLKPDEMAYVLQDSGARAMIVSQLLAVVGACVAETLPDPCCCLVLGDGEEAPAGFQSKHATVDGIDDLPLTEELEGQPMLYSAGTTGRPKGIRPQFMHKPFGFPVLMESLMRQAWDFGENSVLLCPAPLYHAAPLAWSTTAHRLGGSVILMEHFDANEVLQLIARHRVTHAFMVPTHFVRLLKLPDIERDAFDLSSLRCVVHAGAPCPLEVKLRMLAWWGPILHEYYSCSEGIGSTMIGPHDWLDHPGSVGRAAGCQIRILNEFGAELPPGQTGQVYFEGGASFHYHNDPQKTAAAYDTNGRSTVGDMGYLDTDGYLYLTGRASHMIISGGANIYPEEIENVLAMHPAVADVAVIGVPNSEYGEEVKALIVPADPTRATSDLINELIDCCREHIANFKCPRSIEFVESLPRLPTGKLAKRLLEEQYSSSAALRSAIQPSIHS